MGLDGDPEFVRVDRFIRAMPRYCVGHQACVRRIEGRAARHRRLAFAGNAYRGVGLPDAIRSGESAAARMVSDLLDAGG